MSEVIDYRIDYENETKRARLRAEWDVRGSPEDETKPNEADWFESRRIKTRKTAEAFVRQLGDQVEIFVFAHIKDGRDIDEREVGHKDPGGELRVDWTAKSPRRRP